LLSQAIREGLGSVKLWQQLGNSKGRRHYRGVRAYSRLLRRLLPNRPKNIRASVPSSHQ
jgi:hypothetical protein